MSLSSMHPDFAAALPSWSKMTHLYEGEDTVKNEGTTYLHPTAGMRLDGMDKDKEGYADYEAYKSRAVFPDNVAEAVVKAIGLMHKKEASIKLPAKMESLRKKATIAGESLQLLLSKINEQQLVNGRLGLIADLPINVDQSNPMPYISMYVAQSIINWDDGSYVDGFNSLNLVVLNESGYVRTDDFNWELKQKHRVLQLGKLKENESEAIYFQGTFQGSQTYNQAEMTAPAVRGTKLKQIPFVFVNTKDITTRIDRPPLLGLGNLALTIYRGEADYRQNLYMQSQETLVTIGAYSRSHESIPDSKPEELRVGAGARIEMDTGGDAKYIGVSAAGLTEQRTSLENDKKAADTKAGQLFNADHTGQESGEAMKTRVSAQSASLHQIAKTGAAGLEYILKIIAVWIGVNPDEVEVIPNLEFSDYSLVGTEFVALTTARSMGAPLSNESIHALMVEHGISKFDYETEMQKLSDEKAAEPLPGTVAGGNPPVEE